MQVEQQISNDRSDLISKLLSDFDTRAAYISSKVSTLVPSQIRGLRLKSETPRQPDLARAAKMHQSRISTLETAGANPTIGTLSEIAAALKVGLKVEFVPFSEMLAWENEFSQDDFNPTRIDQDQAFLNPNMASSPVPKVRDTSWITMEVLQHLQKAQESLVNPIPDRWVNETGISGLTSGVSTETALVRTGAVTYIGLLGTVNNRYVTHWDKQGRGSVTSSPQRGYAIEPVQMIYPFASPKETEEYSHHA